MLRQFCRSALFSAWLIALAQPGPVPQGQQPAKAGASYKLEGTVLNAQTGQPIPHALVEAYGSKKLAVLTGSEGTFVLEQLPEGTLMLNARKPGFFPLGDSGQSPTLKNLQIGPQLDKVVLKLVPECAISGQVSDDGDAPLEGAEVEALNMRIIDGRREPMPVRGDVRTDEDGNFRIGGLPAGRYYVTVKAGAVTRRILGSQSKTGSQAYPALVYYPSAADIASATPIDLVAGQRAQTQFSLRLEPAFKLAGAISGTSAYKQAGPPLIVDQLDRLLFNPNRWDSHAGTFEFPAMPAGVYALRLYAVDADDNPLWLKQTVNLNRDVNNLNLTFPPAVTLPVIVRSEFNGPAIERPCVEGTRDGKKLDCNAIAAMVHLASVDSSRLQRASQPGGESDAAPLVVRSVPPGRYRVRVIAMNGGYVYSLRSGSLDLLREELIVPAGGNTPAIEVVLRDGGGTVKVHVQSDSAEKQGRILLMPEFAPSQPPISIGIDPNRDQEYGNLAPGDYKVLAFDSLDGIEYNNPDFLAKYSMKAARVTLYAHTTSPVTVELVHTGE